MNNSFATTLKNVILNLIAIAFALVVLIVFIYWQSSYPNGGMFGFLYVDIPGWWVSTLKGWIDSLHDNADTIPSAIYLFVVLALMGILMAGAALWYLFITGVFAFMLYLLFPSLQKLMLMMVAEVGSDMPSTSISDLIMGRTTQEEARKAHIDAKAIAEVLDAKQEERKKQKQKQYLPWNDD